MVVHTWAITSASRPLYRSLVCIVGVCVAVLVKRINLSAQVGSGYFSLVQG